MGSQALIWRFFFFLNSSNEPNHILGGKHRQQFAIQKFQMRASVLTFLEITEINSSSGCERKSPFFDLNLLYFIFIFYFWGFSTQSWLWAQRTMFHLLSWRFSYKWNSTKACQTPTTQERWWRGDGKSNETHLRCAYGTLCWQLVFMWGRSQWPGPPYLTAFQCELVMQQSAPPTCLLGHITPHSLYLHKETLMLLCLSYIVITLWPNFLGIIGREGI